MKLRSSVAVALAGLAGAAGLPVTGRHKVDHTVLRQVDPRTSRSVLLEVWYPANHAGAPFPLLLFSPGFGNKPALYLSQLEEFASHGYIVAGLDHADDTLDAFEPRALLRARDILFGKEQLLRSALRQMIDADQVGAFGHSLGGRAAAAACLLDSSIRACLNQDSGNDDVQLQRPYWPIYGRTFAGAFAMLDWFDPGLDDEDFRSMGKTLQQYAATRLIPSAAALDAYRAAQRGAYRITILSPGMRHTAFTDDRWSNAGTDAERARYAGYLNQVRAITLGFFDRAFGRSATTPACGEANRESYTQCFTPMTK